jgi:hypothetical protein
MPNSQNSDKEWTQCLRSVFATLQVKFSSEMDREVFTMEYEKAFCWDHCSVTFLRSGITGSLTDTDRIADSDDSSDLALAQVLYLSSEGINWFMITTVSPPHPKIQPRRLKMSCKRLYLISLPSLGGTL